ncbi:hypothetical protein IJM86_02000 [bacterium]|nr:hypothetical protein [bacterium]
MTNSKETLSHELTQEEIIKQETKQEIDNLQTTVQSSIDGIDKVETWVPVEAKTAKDLKKKLNLNDNEVNTDEMQYQNEKGKECYKIPIQKTVQGPDNTEYTFKSTVFIAKKDGKYVYTNGTYHNQYELITPTGETPRKSSNGKLVINNLVFNIPKENSEISGFNIERSPLDTEASYKNNIAKSKYAVTFETGAETDTIKKLKVQQEENLFYEGANSDENKA